MEEQRDSFIFYRSFYEAIKDLPDVDRYRLYDAIAEYCLNFEEPTLTGIEKTLWKLIRPQLDANNKRFIDGKKGGRPKKKTSGYEDKKTSGYETEKPNVNVNGNVNDNLNKNENKKQDIYADREIGKFKRNYEKFTCNRVPNSKKALEKISDIIYNDVEYDESYWIDIFEKVKGAYWLFDGVKKVPSFDNILDNHYKISDNSYNLEKEKEPVKYEFIPEFEVPEGF